MHEYEIFIEDINPCGGEQYSKKTLIEAEAASPEAYVKKWKISNSRIHTQREWRCCNSNRRQSGFFCTLYFYGIRMPVSKEWIL